MTARFRTLALAALGAALPGATEGWSNDMLPACVAELRRALPEDNPPDEADRRLLRLADALDLDDAELMAVALRVAIDADAQVARVVAEAQGPVGSSRPLLGFVVSILEPVGATVIGLACGPAVTSGLLLLGGETAALGERSLSLPLPILAALHGRTMAPDGVTLARPLPIPLPGSVVAQAASRAAVMAGRRSAGLILRSSDMTDARSVAHHVGEALGLGLALVGEPAPACLAPWLIASGRMPVFAPHLGPGQRWSLPPLAPYQGPWIVTPGPDGAVDADETPDDWTLGVPDIEARVRLWTDAGATRTVARKAAETFRQGAGRIAEVAARARLFTTSRGGTRVTWPDITTAIATGTSGLDALARLARARVDDDALVLPPSLREALDLLLDRARTRCTLADDLGPAVRSRYRPGVRALFVGESGTGKTLAAHWMATRLGLPLYRVDLAALTSKYIGETEKNLSAVLGAAEHADVLLFFDEADALFGARTDVSDSHDRFANAQTNYLLQRIEDFDGIAVLASNSRDRFDPAFSRRLDAILEFPMPEGPARRALWTAHLGTRHGLTEADLDRLAVMVDLAGGHIRNIVLAGSARAATARRPIAWADLAAATRDEYRKLGRPEPNLG